ncbi:MAG: tRNA preQ1(34) S-adenosylmethionine ribosyltransferase-isomerase QueA [Bacteroidota bacterium]|nr:tRNA preQ1(34) S-adenosylmethionine ribosyltransferase-isomerase QueA [Bacteroidota bacterium]MDP4230533.1 tRNA preQ1(34) S-adenosylmethionine ribosyltransferase-isomerase QueA [Bacteroidota bacterium]MDP4236124.1 tRNA preQ1(34) S-adenosylmethionine ribosyltransferase-isomerase QueA [Bacteroidota bacterium]
MIPQHLSDFDYPLPDELIARYPPAHREDSRLLVLDRATGSVHDNTFPEIFSYFNAGDVLVINETRVIPARLQGMRETTGARVEIFLLHKQADRTDTWHALAAPAKKVKRGETIVITDDLSCIVLEELPVGERIVQFKSASGNIESAIEKAGSMPIPPYLNREAEEIDKERYQTVFARINGAVAAPTASLHFTEDLLSKIESKGVHIVKVLLHVGLGTFRPVEVEDIRQHSMHAEYFEVGEDAARAINAAKDRGSKVVAVGTTTARTLESAADEGGMIKAQSGDTSIFIYPPYTFKIVDALITNFHQPKSSLLMMISAFAGYENVMKAYRHAIEKRYRFLSYGDAMLIV